MTTNWSFSRWRRFQFLYICIDWMTLPIYDSLTFFRNFFYFFHLNLFFYFLLIKQIFFIFYTRSTYTMACDIFALGIKNNQNKIILIEMFLKKIDFKRTKYTLLWYHTAAMLHFFFSIERIFCCNFHRSSRESVFVFVVCIYFRLYRLSRFHWCVNEYRREYIKLLDWL